MTPLYLMKADLDMVNMARYAAEQKHSDPDRAAHCLMRESFGRNAPQPFVIKVFEEGGNVCGTALAYTPLTEKELQEAAGRNQKLAHSAVLDPSTIRTIPVKDEWERGQKIRFEVRVSPARRTSDRDKEHPNAEQDAYLALQAQGLDTTRAEAYCEWLSEMMRREGTLEAVPGSLTMNKFAIRRIKRQKSSGWHKGPDATITGTVTVTKPEQMRDLLAGGIGRHKSFGYGMLLLRPA